MAKKKKAKLPKKIMGVKIPKQLRRMELAGVLASPIAMNLIADMVFAAGAALSNPSKDKAAMGNARRAFSGVAEDMEGSPGEQVSIMREAMTEAIRAFVSTLKHGQRKGESNGEGGRSSSRRRAHLEDEDDEDDARVHH